MSTGILTKWGNSQGVIIPKNFCDQLEIKVGDVLNVDIKDDEIVIRPERPFILSALMNGYNGPTPTEYDWGRPMGKEVW